MKNTTKLGFELPNGYNMKAVILDCSLGIDGYGPPGLFGTIVNEKIDRINSTTILKSITRHPKIGNFGSSIFSKNGWAMTDYGFPLPKKFCYIRVDGKSACNSFGLSNDGFDKFNNMDCFIFREIVISIFFEFGKGSKKDIENAYNNAIYMGQKLCTGYTNKGYKVVAVVINISCPNDGNGVCLFADEIVKVVKAFKSAIRQVPIGVKYSYMQNISLAKAIDENIDIAFHQAINTVPFKVIYGNKKFSPLSHIGHGGVSGPAIKNMALEYGIMLREAKLRGKLVLGGGISSLDDAIERAKYADAIALGILINTNTKLSNEIISYFA